MKYACICEPSGSGTNQFCNACGFDESGHASVARDETCWLIERYLPGTQDAVWLMADGKWTAIAQRAARFSEDGDAAVEIDHVGLTGQCWPTKHVFVN